MTNVLRDSNVQQVVGGVHEVLRPGAINLNDPDILYMPGRQWADERGGAVHRGDYLRRRIGEGSVVLSTRTSQRRLFGRPIGAPETTVQLRHFHPVGSDHGSREVVINLTHTRDLPPETAREAIGILSKFGSKISFIEEEK